MYLKTDFHDADLYQSFCKKTAIYPDQGNNLYYPALGLGEAGEVQNLIKKVMRDDNGVLSEEKKAALGKELGDLMWYVATLATEAGLSLSGIMANNLNKLDQRKSNGTLSGSGDNR